MPAGLVKTPPPPPPPPRKRLKSDTGEAIDVTSAQSSQEQWDPEQVTDEPKSKRWWDKGKAGRKKKLRALDHWVSLNHKNFKNMHQNDFVPGGLDEWEFPAYEFRTQARKWEVLRYFSFLIQMVLKLVKVWHPTRAQNKTLWTGVQHRCTDRFADHAHRTIAT